MIGEPENVTETYIRSLRDEIREVRETGGRRVSIHYEELQDLIAGNVRLRHLRTVE